MKEDGSKYEANGEEIEDELPAACPFCGHSGVFDGHGKIPDKLTTVKSGIEKTYRVIKPRFRCPECNGRFEMWGKVDQLSQERR